MEGERILQNSFYETSVIFVSKPVKDSIRKDNCRPTTFMNVDE